MYAKFLLACCLFSFITGGYLVIIYQQSKDTKCTVSFQRDQQTHVFIGSR
jgi:hypothetical protein